MIVPSDTIGYAAGILLVICLLPQLIVIHKNKSSENVSITMYVFLVIGQILWVCYGILKSDTVLIAMNSSSVVITLSILLSAIFYKIKKSRENTG